MNLQELVSKSLASIRDGQNLGEPIGHIDVVCWCDDELVDVTGMQLVRYAEDGPLFIEIDTETRYV